jgi:hypothetical protein
MANKHILKTDPYAWDMVECGKKTYELRYNDRAFSEGDHLILDRTLYTGAEMKAGAPLIYGEKGIECEILHVLRGPVYGLADKWCILSIRKLYTHSFMNLDPTHAGPCNREAKWISQLDMMKRLRNESYNQSKNKNKEEREG